MRSLAVGFALVLGVAVPLRASAEGPPLPQPFPMLIRVAAYDQLSVLLKKLQTRPVKKAVAAQCADEGENCTSDAQCCSGLECTGAPHATCMPAD
jgi:hypothetical protein